MSKYIDADALIRDITAAEKNRGMGAVIASTLKRYVARMLAADVEPVRHGKWIKETRHTEWGTEYVHYRCSECGRNLIGYNNPNDVPYCHCGAKMDGGKDD